MLASKSEKQKPVAALCVCSKHSLFTRSYQPHDEKLSNILILIRANITVMRASQRYSLNYISTEIKTNPSSEHDVIFKRFSLIPMTSSIDANVCFYYYLHFRHKRQFQFFLRFLALSIYSCGTDAMNVFLALKRDSTSKFMPITNFISNNNNPKKNISSSYSTETNKKE